MSDHKSDHMTGPATDPAATAAPADERAPATATDTADDPVVATTATTAAAAEAASGTAPEAGSPRDALLALFEAHATARLRGDTETALRAALDIGEGQRMSHLLFMITLFAAVVVGHLGDQPDPEDLAAFTKRLHSKHFRPGGTFNALRAEAMIRAVCSEPLLLTEIPHTEQPAYMWAVMGELVDPDIGDADLAELFTLAENARGGLILEALEAPIFKPPHARGSHEDTTVHASPDSNPDPVPNPAAEGASE